MTKWDIAEAMGLSIEENELKGNTEKYFKVYVTGADSKEYYVTRIIEKTEDAAKERAAKYYFNKINKLCFHIDGTASAYYCSFKG